MAFGVSIGTGTASGTSLAASNNITITGSPTVAVGDLIVVQACVNTTTAVTGASDNLGNTYTAQNAGTSSTVNGRMFYARVTNPGSLTTVTVTATATGVAFSLVAQAFGGPFAATSITDTNPANNTADITSPFNPPATGALAQAPDFLVCWSANNSNTAWSASSPQTLGAQVSQASTHAVLGYQVLTAKTTVTPAFTGTAPTVNVMGTVTFKEAQFTELGAQTDQEPQKKPGKIPTLVRGAAIAASTFATGPWAPPSAPAGAAISAYGASQPTVIRSQLVYDPECDAIPFFQVIRSTITGTGQPIVRCGRLVYDPRTGPVAPPVVAIWADPDENQGFKRKPTRALANEPGVFAPRPVTWSDQDETLPLRRRTRQLLNETAVVAPAPFTPTPSSYADASDLPPDRPKPKQSLEIVWPLTVPPAAVVTIASTITGAGQPTVLRSWLTYDPETGPVGSVGLPVAAPSITTTGASQPIVRYGRLIYDPRTGPVFPPTVVVTTPAALADAQEQPVRAPRKRLAKEDFAGPPLFYTVTPTFYPDYQEQRAKARRRDFTWQDVPSWGFIPTVVVTITPSAFPDYQEQRVRAPAKRLPKEEASGVTFIPVTYADTFTSVWTGKKKQLRLEQTFFIEPFAVTPADLQWFDTSSRIRAPLPKQPDPFSFVFPSFVTPPTTTPSALADVAYLNSVLKPNKVAIQLALDGLAWAPQERPIGVVEQPPGGIGKPPVGRYALYVEWCPRDRFWKCIRPPEWVAEDTLGIDVQVTAPAEIIERTKIKGLPKIAKRALSDLAPPSLRQPTPIRVTYVLQPPDEDDEEELMINLLLNS